MTVAAAVAATIVFSVSLTSCQGRKMDNMEPKGETVEVDISTAKEADSAMQPTDDSAATIAEDPARWPIGRHR